MLKTRYPAILSDVESLNTSWRNARLLIKQILTDKISIARSKFTSVSKITSNLGGDSLDIVEIAITLETLTGIRVNERVPFDYVLEIADYLHFIRTWEK